MLVTLVWVGIGSGMLVVDRFIDWLGKSTHRRADPFDRAAIRMLVSHFNERTIPPLYRWCVLIPSTHVVNH